MFKNIFLVVSLALSSYTSFYQRQCRPCFSELHSYQLCCCCTSIFIQILIINRTNLLFSPPVRKHYCRTKHYEHRVSSTFYKVFHRNTVTFIRICIQISVAGMQICSFPSFAKVLLLRFFAKYFV